MALFVKKGGLDAYCLLIGPYAHPDSSSFELHDSIQIQGVKMYEI